MSAATKELAIGIDLGTTNSCVAAVIDGTPTVIPNGGYLTTPSVVAFAASGKRLVGHQAKRQAITNPEHTIIAMKRLIGRKLDGLEVGTAMSSQAALAAGPHGDVRVTLRDTSYSLPELSAMLLQDLRAAAEAHLEVPTPKAVITVPAYFNDNQRQATRDAGEIAGLDVVAILNEPTAAALAYGATYRGNRTVVVYDLGGGTFDVSVVKTSPNGVFEVLATGGDTRLGGEDFDDRVIKWLVRVIKEEHQVDLSNDRMAMQRLKFAAETAKCALSSAEQAEISLPHIATGAAGQGISVTRTITRAEFGWLIEDLVEKTIAVCTEVLWASRVPKEKIDDVLLVGGSSRVASVHAAVTACFGKAPSQRVNPDEAVAVGAALHAESIVSGGGSLKLLDVTPQTLGILTEGARPYAVIPRNTRVPTKRTMTFSTRRGQRNVDFVVMQGDSAEAKANALLGRFRMSGFGREAASIDVTFAIDDDGIVEVSARDHASGREQSIRVSASSGLTGEEIARMAATSSRFLDDKRKGALRDAAAQEVKKAIARLEKTSAGATKALGEGRKKGPKGGKGPDPARAVALLEDATATVEAAHAALETADIPALESLVATLDEAEKALRSAASG
jgi:molecular chaperone DnaK